MKKAFLALGIAAGLIASAVAPMVFGQDVPDGITVQYRTEPLANSRILGSATKSAAAVSSSSIPLWTYTVTSPVDNITYSGQMVGASPYMNGARTTNIPTVVIPLIVRLADGSTFDPTTSDSCTSWGDSITQVMASPIFQTAPYTMAGINMGTGQYIDEFQRANFYNTTVSETGDSYHTVLSPVTKVTPQIVNIPSSGGAVNNLFSCSSFAVVDYQTMLSVMTSTVLPSVVSQGLVTPSSFALFVVHNVVFGNPGTSAKRTCCIFGYHSAYSTSAGTQTFALADFDTSGGLPTPDIQPTSRVVGEWIDNPLASNSVPSWGRIGSVVACSSLLEVGEPLGGSPPFTYSESGKFGVKMPNGHIYAPQELTFFSWFYRQLPSIGTGNVYSNSGTLLGNAGSPVCAL